MTNKAKASIYTALVVLVIVGLFSLTVIFPVTAIHIFLYITCGILVSGIIAVIHMMIMDLVFNEEVPHTSETISNVKPEPTIRKEDVAPPPPFRNSNMKYVELHTKYDQLVQDNTRLTLENERLRQSMYK
jgi:hypothetical protein